METMLINNEVVSPDFTLFKNDKSFIFGIKNLDLDGKKIIKDSINSSEAEIYIDNDNNLLLQTGEKVYSFNLDPYFGFFSPSKFYVGFDFIDDKNHFVDNYRRMFMIKKK